MPSFYDQMRNFFEGDNWPYEPYEDIRALRLPFRGKSGEWACIAQTDEETRLFTFYSVCPEKAPEEYRMVAAEFITLANYGMPFGNLEMDFIDGEIRFKTSVGFGETDWSDILIDVAVHTNVFSMDRYLPRILEVIEGELTPQDALDLAES